jgi:hypothetical protein
MERDFYQMSKLPSCFKVLRIIAILASPDDSSTTRERGLQELTAFILSH